MDSKIRHEQFVTGLAGGSVGEIYGVIAVCIISLVTYHFVSRSADGKLPSLLSDFLFGWACVLAATTVYADKLWALAVFLGLTASLAYKTGGTLSTKDKHASTKQKPVKKTQAPPVVAYRSYLSVYRASMLVLTVTAILAVDFPVFPRRFAKTETWGTSLMDLGVGSFVFSMGVVTARRSFKFPNIRFLVELKESLIQTSKVLALGFVRLLVVKVANYQEHVSEYGVHWNFFFTLGLLPFFFTIVNRIPFPGKSLGRGIAIALGYELLLKNVGLQEWALIAPRTSIISQNKEGLVSFAGYLAIFVFGYNAGLYILSPKQEHRSVIVRLTKSAIVAQILYYILIIATEPSRRIANLPYVVWVVAFNSGLLAILAALEHYIGMVPSRSYELVNKYGESVFIMGNVATGLVNLGIDTLSLNKYSSIGVLLCYQLVLLSATNYLQSKS